MRYFASASRAGRLGGQQLVAVVVEVADDRHLDAHHRQLVDDARHRGRGFGGVDRDPHQLRAGAPQVGDLLRRSRRRRRCRCWSSTAPTTGAPPPTCTPPIAHLRGSGGAARGRRQGSAQGGDGVGIHGRIVAPCARSVSIRRCSARSDRPVAARHAFQARRHDARRRDVLTPSQLNTLARDLLEGAFPLIWVEGELGNLSRPSSGHLYFTLKDARAQVRCAMFKPKSQWLKFVPRDGLRVLARGRLTLYEARGEYQLVLDHMEEAGEGALRRAFEELKAKLAAEGLFDAERKRPLPALRAPPRRDHLAQRRRGARRAQRAGAALPAARGRGPAGAGAGRDAPPRRSRRCCSARRPAAATTCCC